MCRVRGERVRGGFTLVELLVVIAIIVTVLALLLPAVQKVRESANKAYCANNLRNIGRAIANYTVSHRNYYPTGGGDPNVSRVLYANSTPARELDQDWGWMYQILPYLDQENLWKLRAGGPPAGPDAAGDAQIAATPIVLYFCPSRRVPKVLDTGRAANDYAGNFGAFNPILNGDPHNTCLNSAVASGVIGMFRNGIFIKNRYKQSSGSYAALDSLIGPRDVTDGLSYTLMVGEKWINDDVAAAGGQPQLGDDNGYIDGFSFCTLRAGGFPPMHDGNGDDIRLGGFGSAHPASMNALFADGSIRAVRYDIPASPQVLQVWSVPLGDLGVPPLPSPPYPDRSTPLTLFQRLCHRADGGTISAAEVE